MTMADQLTFAALGAYGHPIIKTPNIDALAERGVLFENCYCPSPLCVPSRASMMSGRLPTNIASFDNACELPAGVPTFVHHLRLAGYRTIISGKMHFIGPDQLHGFEERLNPDIYPSGFDWTPDWRNGAYPNDGTHVRKLKRSGPVEWTHQLDYDEETHRLAIGRLRRLAREKDTPFFFCVSYSHPHEPFQITREFWDFYEGVDINEPQAPARAFDKMNQYEQWIQVHHGIDTDPPGMEEILASRRAYYGMVTYVDRKVGELLSELERLGLSDDTLVIFTSDHGEMLGEHGMWYKRTYHEWSSHVPLIIARPGGKTRRAREIVSLVDLYPTILDLAGVDFDASSLDGASFAKALDGSTPGWKDIAFIEYCGEGTVKPMRAIRKGRFKYVLVPEMQPLLFDIEMNPLEQEDLRGRSELAEIEAALEAELLGGWNAEQIEQDVLRSQQTRLLLLKALTNGRHHPWDYVPPPETP